jgi:hypothetical protein
MTREGTKAPVIHFVLLIACAAVIYLACTWFVNAVEWLGQRLRVGPLAVGTILAAFGTALPESVVTFVAVVSRVRAVPGCQPAQLPGHRARQDPGDRPGPANRRPRNQATPAQPNTVARQ